MKSYRQFYYNKYFKLLLFARELCEKKTMIYNKNIK